MKQLWIPLLLLTGAFFATAWGGGGSYIGILSSLLHPQDDLTEFVQRLLHESRQIVAEELVHVNNNRNLSNSDLAWDYFRRFLNSKRDTEGQVAVDDILWFVQQAGAPERTQWFRVLVFKTLSKLGCGKGGYCRL